MYLSILKSVKMKIKQLYWPVLVVLFLTANSCTNQSQEDVSDEANTTDVQGKNSERKKVVLPRFPSPAASLEQTIGLSTIKINYSRPSVISPEGIDRTSRIWGVLVPYDFNARPSSSEGKPIPWRAGANENTTIAFSHDAQVEGNPIPAGSYGLHIAIHEAGGATVIFSKKTDAWGSFSYDEADDVLRVEAETTENEHTPRLKYSIENVDGTLGRVSLDWELKRIAFKVAFDTHGMVMTGFEEYLTDTTGLKGKDYERAAKYCADNNLNLDDGLTWIDLAIARGESFGSLGVKAQLLVAKGQTEEAQIVQSQALALPSTTAKNYYSYGTQLLKKGDRKAAQDIYEKLMTKWPDEWVAPHGMARIHSAMGNYDQAIEFEKDALAKAPDVNKGYIEWAISKLEKGINFN